MPDTEITVTRGADWLDLLIRLPLPDLLLVLPATFPSDADALLKEHVAGLRAYLAAHTRVLALEGPPIPFAIGAVRLHHRSNAVVGDYAELEATASVRVKEGVPVTLNYDGVLHKVANHRAFVRDGSGKLIGIIRYSLRSAPSFCRCRGSHDWLSGRRQVRNCRCPPRACSQVK